MGDEKEQNGRKLIGTLEPFVVGESDFDDYLSIVDNYFELNHVEEDNYKVRLLVNMIGSTASTKIIKAFKPIEIGKVKYSQLIEKCKKLFSVEKNAIMEHFKFNNRAQKPGEGLSDYAIELQSLAEHCKFGALLDTMLRDKFVCGLRSVSTKKALLKLDEGKSFADTVEHAKKEELLSREAGSMQIDEGGNVHRVFSQNRSDNRMRDNRSRSKVQNNERRYKGRSKSRGDKCHRCGQVGHYVRNCAAKPSAQRKSFKNWRSTTNAIESLEGFGTLDLNKSRREENQNLIAQINIVSR
jgi:Zinc knuckle